ncbi:hypothetical protein [Lichenihabitans psoromatis]|uniref:hypothetical protein n=1 Tax=Lichenihabitans psoromatis TaxID=2528642 RepID=UPI001036EB81|nr:hypothetical protein [Lichenihabitans psoromatis]
MSEIALLQAASPDRIAALIGHGASSNLVTRLLRSTRLRARLAEVVSARLGLVGSMTPVQAAILDLSEVGLSTLARRAGAIWHGRAIARAIDASDRRALVATLGTSLYGQALRGIALSPELPGDLQGPEALDVAVATDGAACLEAWRLAQPPGVALRVGLLRATVLVEALHRERGPSIVAWLVQA